MKCYMYCMYVCVPYVYICIEFVEVFDIAYHIQGGFPNSALLSEDICQ